MNSYKECMKCNDSAYLDIVNEFIGLAILAKVFILDILEDLHAIRTSKSGIECACCETACAITEMAFPLTWERCFHIFFLFLFVFLTSAKSSRLLTACCHQSFLWRWLADFLWCSLLMNDITKTVMGVHELLALFLFFTLHFSILFPECCSLDFLSSLPKLLLLWRWCLLFHIHFLHCFRSCWLRRLGILLICWIWILAFCFLPLWSLFYYHVKFSKKLNYS